MDTQFLKSKNLPMHVAIIMDGNGRWAKKRGLNRLEGHNKGVRIVKQIVRRCCDLGIKYLTLYSFSVDNWKRPDNEVEGLMELLFKFVLKEEQEMMEQGIRLTTIGDIKRLPEKVFNAITGVIENTGNNSRMNLCLAISYGGREEILAGIKSLCMDIKAGRLDIETLDKSLIEKYLYTYGMPDPDLLIRTSGEQRLSNFLLWQTAYSEILITPTLWPDFNVEAFDNALVEYMNRERRFGKTGDQILID